MFIVIAHTHLNPQEFASVYSKAGWAIFNEMQVGIPVQNKTCKDFFLHGENLLVPQKGVSRSISTNCGRGSKKPLKIFAQKEELNTMACVSNILPHTSTQTLSLRAVKRSAQFCISLTKFVSEGLF